MASRCGGCRRAARSSRVLSSGHDRLVDLAEEGQRQVPRTAARPAQLGRGRLQRRNRRRQLGQHAGRRHDGDEQPHAAIRISPRQAADAGQLGWSQVGPDLDAAAAGQQQVITTVAITEMTPPAIMLIRAP